MKKFILLVLPFYLFTFLPLKADEGMWTLYNLPNAVYETMKQENYQLPYGALYQGEDAVKNCVVNFGGFTRRSGVHEPPLRFRGHPLALYRRTRLHAQWLRIELV